MQQSFDTLDYLRILDDYSNFEKYIFKEDFVMGVRLIHDKKGNNLNKIKIFYQSEVTLDVRIMLLCKDDGNNILSAKAELYDNNGNKIEGNNYDWDRFNIILQKIKNYRTNIEQNFMVTLDEISFTNPNSKYKFYKNENCYVISDKKYVYRFRDYDVFKVFAIQDDKFADINVYECEDWIKPIMKLCLHYINYVENDNTMIFENEEIYINKEKLVKNIKDTDGFSNLFLYQIIGMVVELVSIGIAVFLVLTSFITVLSGNVRPLIVSVPLSIGLIILPLKVFTCFFNKEHSVYSLENINKKYIPIDHEVMKSLDSHFKPFVEQLQKKSVDSMEFTNKNLSFETKEKTKKSKNTNSVGCYIKSKTGYNLLDDYVIHINNMIIKINEFGKNDILSKVGPLISDLDTLCKNYEYLPESEKALLLNNIIVLDKKLSNSTKDNKKIDLIKMSSLNSAINQILQEL